jgi:hypothetical protein
MNLIRKKLIAILIGVLFTFISHQTACAYYDPGVQRWINRDPLGDNAFVYTYLLGLSRHGPSAEYVRRENVQLQAARSQYYLAANSTHAMPLRLSLSSEANQYTFVASSPINMVDLLGLWGTCSYSCINPTWPVGELFVCTLDSSKDCDSCSQFAIFLINPRVSEGWIGVKIKVRCPTTSC